MGALRLYCDLLSMPGVLKPEHSHYAVELRLLNTRSEALIEHLIQLLSQGRVDVHSKDIASKEANFDSSLGAEAHIAEADAVGRLASPSKPVSRRRPAAASTTLEESGNGIDEASVTDRRSGSFPPQLTAVPNMPKVSGASGKLSSSGLPDAVESSAINSKSRSKHRDDSKPGAGGIESC
jgi:hypothetical protein